MLISIYDIQVRSPSLKLLVIGWQNKFTDDEFLDFLVHMPSIIHLDGDISEALSGPKLLHHIALRPNLQTLRLVESTIFQPVASGHTILPALRILNVVVKREHEKYLLPALRMLKQLRSITLDKFSVCPPLMLKWLSSCCPLLEELTVWEDCLRVTGETLVFFARGCPILRHLNMHIGSNRDYTFTDESIEELTSLLPGLECLRLSRELPSLSIRALVSFARNCPRLQHLDLPGIFELTSLFDEPTSITFPSLETLTINHTKPATDRRLADVDGPRLERRRERVIAVLDSRFPALKTFEMLAGGNEYSGDEWY